MISILYQNNVTGDAFDVTMLCAGAKWSTKRSGSPASLELTVIVDDSVTWTHGGIVALKDGKTGIFYGYVVKIRQKETDRVEVTAYDQTWYLKKNKETYVFTGKRADQILTQIAADFGLKCGALENTGYAIPSMIAESRVILSPEMHRVDDGQHAAHGKHTGCPFGEQGLDLFVGDSSLATGYTYETDIDSESYNKIKLVRDNKKTGKRDVYIFQDSKNIKLWGVLQNYETVDEDMNEAQIKERGGQMLELYNRPKKSFEVKALLDLSVRAGRALYIGIKDVGVSSFFIVEEASADLLKEQMTLKLKVV